MFLNYSNTAKVEKLFFNVLLLITVCRRSHWWSCRPNQMQLAATVCWLAIYFRSKHAVCKVTINQTKIIHVYLCILFCFFI